VCGEQKTLKHRHSTICVAAGIAEGTKCYVCGGLSAVAETCIDEYPPAQREKDLKDCNEVLGHTEGCTKSKYVDKEGHQIGMGIRWTTLCYTRM